MILNVENIRCFKLMIVKIKIKLFFQNIVRIYMYIYVNENECLKFDKQIVVYF